MINKKKLTRLAKERYGSIDNLCNAANISRKSFDRLGENTRESTLTKLVMALNTVYRGNFVIKPRKLFVNDDFKTEGNQKKN